MSTDWKPQPSPLYAVCPRCPGFGVLQVIGWAPTGPIYVQFAAPGTDKAATAPGVWSPKLRAAWGELRYHPSYEAAKADVERHGSEYSKTFQESWAAVENELRNIRAGAE